MRNACAALLFAVIVSRGASATLFLDHFDGYANQAALLAVWPQAEDGSSSVLLSTDQSASAPQSVRLGLGGGGQGDRNIHSVGELGLPSATNSIRFSFDFYDTNAAAEPYAQSASIAEADGSAAGQLVSIGLNNNLTADAQGGNFYMARIRAFNGSAFFKLNEGGATTLRSTGWHNLAVEISFVGASALRYEFYVDSILARTLPNVSMTLRSFDSIFLGSAVPSTDMAYVDNVRVENFNPTAVPEAGSFLMVVLAAVLCSAGVCVRKLRTLASA